MEIESYTLSDPPFNYVISFPFPENDRKILEEAMISILLKTPKDVLKSLEVELAKKLKSHGYLCSKYHPKICRLWLPDFRNEVDFYNLENRVAIEVEKSEVKRVVHAVLKLINGSLTFMPKVKYGVLIVPETYRRPSGKESPFFNRLKKELPFYFQKIIPNNCNLQDILIIIYKFDRNKGAP